MKIKKIRELKNYTQEYVASSLGISQGHYNKIENGQASLSVDRLVKITQTLGIELIQLLKFDENEIGISS